MDTFSHIANYLSGSCSPEEAARLEEWRKASAANEAEFCKLKKVWEAAAPASFCPDAQQAWKKVQARLCSKAAVVEQEIKPQAKGRRWLQTAWPIAAGFSLLLLSLSLYLLLGKQPAFIPGGLSQTKTKEQEKQLVKLADGSQVWLNQQSSLHYPEQFSSSQREVYLQGEAFFEVSHQPAKPFVVHTSNSQVQVLGTSFNLREGEQTRLQVKAGRVQFSSTKSTAQHTNFFSSIVVNAGEAALLETGALTKESLPLNYLAWKTGEFEFNDTPLEEVFQLLGQYYPVTIKAANPSLLQCRLNAHFAKQPLKEVLEVISLTFGLKYQETGKEVVFLGNSSSCNRQP